MGKSFTNIKGRTSNKKAAGQKKIRPRVVTAVTTRSIRVYENTIQNNPAVLTFDIISLVYNDFINKTNGKTNGLFPFWYIGFWWYVELLKIFY